MSEAPPVALTIAGSDSGGGAGIAADLKTFAAHRVFGTLAITAVTAQDTAKVHAVHALEPLAVDGQIEAVLGDFHVAAAKTGMLATAAIVELVATRAEEGRLPPLVVDPVMVATSGAALLEPAATPAYQRLIATCAVVTPNLPEAEVLLGHPIGDTDAMAEAAEELHLLGAGLAVIKGGHRPGKQAIDVAFDESGRHDLVGDWIPTENVHGTGCTLSAAIAAGLALGRPSLAALRDAKLYVEKALRASSKWQLGTGAGPLDHFPPT